MTFDVCGGLSWFEIVRSYARLTLLVVAGRHTGCGGFELAAAILAVLATAIRACVLSFGLFVCAIRNCCIHAFNLNHLHVLADRCSRIDAEFNRIDMAYAGMKFDGGARGRHWGMPDSGITQFVDTPKRYEL